MGKRQSKEFKRRLAIREKNKNIWKEKVKEVQQEEVPEKKKVHSMEVQILPLKNGLEEIKVTFQEKDDLLRISVDKPTKKTNLIKDDQSKKIKFSKKTEIVFETKAARLADEKRKEEYQKIVFKKLDELKEEYER